MKIPTFITRGFAKRDYISEANDQIRLNGRIDINSPLYQNAIDQYNSNLLKGTVQRLDVPKGFCGYIDPNSGEFRVEPEPVIPLAVRSIPSIEELEEVGINENPIIPYPVDECLHIGLPGSYEYTRGPCGQEDGDNSCSGVLWFSGAGTSSELGTDALNQSICSDGKGINSNTGLATSSPVGGVTDGYPPEVWQAADRVAIGLHAEAGRVEHMDSVKNLLGTVMTSSFFFNIDAPTHRAAGLRVDVTWDTEIKPVKIYGTKYQYTYSWPNNELQDGAKVPAPAPAPAPAVPADEDEDDDLGPN